MHFNHFYIRTTLMANKRFGRYSSTYFKRPPLGTGERWFLMRGNLVWDTIAFVPSKAGLTKEVVSHEGGHSKDVLL